MRRPLLFAAVGAMAVLLGTPPALSDPTPPVSADKPKPKAQPAETRLPAAFARVLPTGKTYAQFAMEADAVQRRVEKLPGVVGVAEDADKGRLHVYTTGRTPAIKGVVFHKVAHDRGTLERQRDRMIASWSSLKGLEIVSFGPDFRTGRLKVVVANPSPAVTAKIRVAAGAQDVLVTKADRRRRTELQTRQWDSRPWSGGIMLGSNQATPYSSKPVCTGGYNLTDRGRGVDVMVTAGHCFGHGHRPTNGWEKKQWGNWRTPVGTVESSVWDGSGPDIGYINLGAGGGHASVYRGGYESGSYWAPVHSYQSSLPRDGQRVCVSGAFSGEMCEAEVDLDLADGNCTTPGGIPACGLFGYRALDPSQPLTGGGDSGAAVYGVRPDKGLHIVGHNTQALGEYRPCRGIVMEGRRCVNASGFEWVGTALRNRPNTMVKTLPPPASSPPADVLAIATRGTGTGTTEVHMLSAASAYRTFSLQTGTILHQTDLRLWKFAAGDYNGDGRTDLYAINTNDGGKTAIHVLDGANNYQRFLLQVKTPVHATDNAIWQLRAGDYNADGRTDLFLINTADSGRTAVHVLNAARNFQEFLVQTLTGHHASQSDIWQFNVADYDGDRRADLYGIATRGTGSGKTEVHILSAASAYQTYVAHQATALHPTDLGIWTFTTADYTRDGRADVIAIATRGTGTGQTEAHVLSADSGFGRFVLQTGTALHPADLSIWTFASRG